MIKCHYVLHTAQRQREKGKVVYVKRGRISRTALEELSVAKGRLWLTKLRYCLSLQCSSVALPTALSIASVLSTLLSALFTALTPKLKCNMTT